MGLLSSLSKLLTRRSNEYYDTLVLTNPNPNAILYGKSVAISGNYAVVGSSEETVVGMSGTAYVYNLASKTPNVPLFVINHPDPEQLLFDDNFSWTVDIDGTIVVIGAEAEQGEYWIDSYDFELQPDSGRVHVYDIMGEVIEDAITINNPIKRRPPKGTFFGAQLAISGDQILVGTRRETYGTNEHEEAEYHSGKAYIYSVATGNLLYTLSNPCEKGTNAYHHFGSSMDVHGNVAIVGAYGVSDEPEFDGSPLPEPESGKVFVYDISNGSLIRTFDNPNIHGRSGGDQFGYSVSVNGYVFAVGTPGEDSGSPDADNNTGVVYIFDISNKKVAAQPPKVLRGTEDDQRFGAAVKITDDYIVVGAPKIDYQNELDLGKIYVFKRTDLSTPFITIENPSPKGISDADHFGEQLSVSGNRIIANAKQETTQLGDDFVNPGNVYIFEIKE